MENQFHHVICFKLSRSHLYKNTLDVHISGDVAPKESFLLENLNGEMQRQANRVAVIHSDSPAV